MVGTLVAVGVDVGVGVLVGVGFFVAGGGPVSVEPTADAGVCEIVCGGAAWQAVRSSASMSDDKKEGG